MDESSSITDTLPVKQTSNMDQHTQLGQEWQTLQNNHEQYEKFALVIKLTSIVLCLSGLAFGLSLRWIAFGIALCWLQEGIFKTYQARLGERLLRIETLLRQAPQDMEAMQLHSAWLLKRPGLLRLLAGYAGSACRPTVTLPYLPLLLALGGEYCFSGL